MATLTILSERNKERLIIFKARWGQFCGVLLISKESRTNSLCGMARSLKHSLKSGKYCYFLYV